MSGQLASSLAASCLRQGSPLIMCLGPVLGRAAMHARAFGTSSSCMSDKQQQAESASTSGQQQQQQQEASSSGTAGAGPDVGQKVYETFKAGYEQVKSKAAGVSGEAVEDKTRSLLTTIAKDLRETLLPAQDIQSVTRMYTGPLAADAGPGVAGELMIVKVPRTGWQQAWDTMSEKLGSIPLVGKLTNFKVADTSAYKKGQEMVEDLKDKYETSDHPVVHKMEDIKSRVFTGSEASRAMHEVRSRDPAFDMLRFLQSVKLDAPMVVKAFLKHDLDTLKLHCGPELLERFSGIFKHFSEQGVFEDPTLLHIGDAEVVEVRMMDNDPFIIVQFHCQQLKCTRDKFGNVIDGSTSSIQRVYYFWGLQQEQTAVVTAEGKVLPPRWVIKDMMWQSMLALV